MGIGFILLTGCTSINVFLDELGHSWLPVSSGQELFSLQVSGVSSSLVIVELPDQVQSEVVLVGDVNSSLVGKNSSVIRPISELGSELCGEVFIHCLEGFQENWVFS